MVKDMSLKVTRDRTIVEKIYELTKYQMQKNVEYYRIPIAKIQDNLLMSDIQDGGYDLGHFEWCNGTRKRHVPLYFGWYSTS